MGGPSQAPRQSFNPCEFRSGKTLPPATLPCPDQGTETYRYNSPTRHQGSKSPDDDSNRPAVGAEKTPVES